MIKMNYTLPYYGLDRRTGRWTIQQIMDKSRLIKCFVTGHWHSPTRIKPYGIPILTGGTFVSDDEWAVGVIGTSSHASQLTFGIHPEYPITWYYELDLT